MEELKIWSVDNHGEARITPLNYAGSTESEGLLEDILAENPDMLEEGLQLVGRQTGTAGGPLDLLGVDPHGRLTVFEIKRGSLNREAVTQVIDYSSDLDGMDPRSLCRHIAEQSGRLGVQKIDDFEEWYSRNYPEDSSLTPVRMVLIGLGVDKTTERMVNYLARSGVDISLLTFHGFKQDDKMLLARKVEVDSSDIVVGARDYVSRSQQFNDSVQSAAIHALVDGITQMIISQVVSFSQTHSKTRRNFNLDYSWYKLADGSWTPSKAATLFIEPRSDGVRLGFHPVAVALATREEFDKIGEEGVEIGKTPKETLLQMGPIDYGLMVSLPSLEAWNERKEQLTALVKKVCERYTGAKRMALSEESNQ